MAAEIDTDKYYTPLAVACRALERAELSANPSVCADTACGSGSLLTAAEDVFKAEHCIGIDSDSHTIRKLRLARPDWRLYVGDLLKRHRAPPTEFAGKNCGADLLVLNPPFSTGPGKYLTVKYFGNTLNCSVAMAHILRSLELFRPRQGAIAVVPESLLYSDTDRDARELLRQSFSLQELIQLSIYTFKGARVNSSFVQFGRPTCEPRPRMASTAPQYTPIPATLVRGGLQMHAFTPARRGVRVLHSTSLATVAANGFSTLTERTSSTAKGRVSGWLILLPRVGSPKQENCRAIYAAETIQLSDCVMGIQFQSESAALIAQRRILESWQSLVHLYRGTGARYITINRLMDWLHGIGIQDGNSMAEIDGLKSN